MNAPVRNRNALVGQLAAWPLHVPVLAPAAPGGLLRRRHGWRDCYASWIWSTPRPAEATTGCRKSPAYPTGLNAEKEASAQGEVGDERRAARAMSRVVKAAFAQTPGQNFPIESPLMSPFSPFPPTPTSVLRLTCRRPGHRCRTPGPTRYRSAAQEIELPDRRPFGAYWPAMHVRDDCVFGLVKAFDAWGGVGLVPC